LHVEKRTSGGLVADVACFTLGPPVARGGEV